MVMVNGKWWPQKVILVPLASPSGGKRKDWRAQWRQWYISFFTFLLLSFSSFCSFPQLRAQEGQQNIFFVFLIESTMQAVEFFSPVFFLSFLYLNAFPFASCFLLLQQCGLKKGFQSFLFLWKKTKTYLTGHIKFCLFKLTSQQVISWYQAANLGVNLWPWTPTWTAMPKSKSSRRVTALMMLVHFQCTSPPAPWREEVTFTWPRVTKWHQKGSEGQRVR